jgi:hypothetical protein
MANLVDRLLPMAQSAAGRCHSCANSRAYDTPTGTEYFCRAFAIPLSADERATIRQCPRWSLWRPIEGQARTTRAARNPLFARIIAAEDQLFWLLKHHLDERGLDLKTLLVLAQPALDCTEDVAWVDGLDDRFDDDTNLPLVDILFELRALGYDSLCRMIERVYSC